MPLSLCSPRVLEPHPYLEGIILLLLPIFWRLSPIRGYNELIPNSTFGVVSKIGQNTQGVFGFWPGWLFLAFQGFYLQIRGNEFLGDSGFLGSFPHLLGHLHFGRRSFAMDPTGEAAGGGGGRPAPGGPHLPGASRLVVLPGAVPSSPFLGKTAEMDLETKASGGRQEKSAAANFAARFLSSESSRLSASSRAPFEATLRMSQAPDIWKLVESFHRPGGKYAAKASFQVGRAFLI